MITDLPLVISADAQTPHQFVITRDGRRRPARLKPSAPDDQRSRGGRS